MANWKNYNGTYEDHEIAAESSAKDLVVQVETLKTSMGNECKQILNRLQQTAAELKQDR